MKISLALGYRLWAEFGCKILKWEEKFMEDSFVYDAKGPTLIIHLPKEFDHHNCRNLRYETDLLMAENYVSRIIFDFTRTRFMDSSGIAVSAPRSSRRLTTASTASTSSNTRPSPALSI